MGMGAYVCIPIRAYALIAVFILTAVLAFIVSLWLDKKRHVPKGELLGRRAAVVALGVLIASASSVAALYECPTYGICVECGYRLLWSLVDSSGGFTIGDFWITVNYTWDSYLIVERSGGELLIEGMDYDNIYSINLTCNRTPVFSGMGNVTMKAYTARSYFILQYVNSTGYPNLFTIEQGTWDHYSNVFHFENGTEWVEIQVSVFRNMVI